MDKYFYLKNIKPRRAKDYPAMVDIVIEAILQKEDLKEIYPPEVEQLVLSRVL